MRVGVTGGTGFVGQYLIRDYGREYDFIVPIRHSADGSSCRENATYIESDFSVESLKNSFRGCDAVIHLAARGMPKDRCPLKMEDYISNVVCAAHVLETCKQLGIRRVVCVSSKAVWGEKHCVDGTELVEMMSVAPDDEYGVSKVCVETLVNFYCQTYGMNIITYRMGEVCGIDLNRGMLNPFWNVVLKNAVGKQPIPIYGTGVSKRDLIYVKDVTRALVRGVQSENVGIYNIGSGNLVTNLEIAQMFCDVFENEAGIKYYPEKEEWGTTLCLCVEKVRNEMGYEIDYTLNEIVKDIRAEYQRYPK